MQKVESPVSMFEDVSVAFAGTSDSELKKAYWLFHSFNNPLLLKAGTRFINLALQLRLPVETVVKTTAFKKFCGGETLEECAAAITKLSGQHIFTALQFSVETQSSEEEFEKITGELLRSIAFASKNPFVPVVCCKPTGIADIEMLERLHASGKPGNADKEALEKVRQRMFRICDAAAVAGKKLFFDAEETWLQRPLDDLINEMMQRFNRNTPVVYNTFQLYAKGRIAALEETVRRARAQNFIAGAKLVRGAYMEKERLHAAEKSEPSPIHPNKTATDEDYNKALKCCIDNLDVIALNAATHNEASCRYLVHLLSEKGLPPNHPHVLFSQLYGMGEHITANLAKSGYHAMKLVPYGPVRETIPYLIRRAEENSAIAGQTSRELSMIERELKRRGLR